MKKIILSIFLMFAISILTIYLAGSYFTKPVPMILGKAPNELNAESVSIEKIHGWYHQSESSSCVLLLHGVRATRLSMISRAKFLKDLGYSVLLIDFQAHGETPGNRITFGYFESNNVKTAVDFLRQTKHCTKVAVIGVSLGGAATLLGDNPPALDALILESVYPRIENAVYNRLHARLGIFFARALAPFLYQQIPIRFNIPLSQLHPIDAIKNVHSPVLIISGTDDKHTTAEETEALFAAAQEPKSLWLIKGAVHEDLHRFAGAAYETRVSSFLKQYMIDESSH